MAAQIDLPNTKLKKHSSKKPSEFVETGHDIICTTRRFSYFDNYVYTINVWARTLEYLTVRL